MDLKRVRRSVIVIFFTFALMLASQGLINAQSNTSKPLPTPPRASDPMSADKSAPSDNTAPLTTFEEELRAKRAIKIAEKEHQDNLNRAREISQLGHDLQQNTKGKAVLDRDELKKVERLEKLTRKVRGEAGGEDDEVKLIKRPVDLESALSQISDATDSLSKNVQNTPRQVVSAAVIDNANVILELIRILRTFLR